MPKIMLDAGHYGKYNPGVVKGYWESDMSWALHNHLKKALEAYGFEVGVTRTNKDKDLGVYDRGLKAKGYDLFISLHSDGAASEPPKRVSAFHPISGKGKDLAQKLADTVLNTMNLTKDKNWYAHVGTRAYSAAKPNTDYYGVIRGAVAAGSIGILIEHSFHTNKEACTWLMKDANLKKLAQAEAKVIADYYGMTKNEVLYRVQTGAFTNKKNATAMLTKVKAAGFKDAFMVKVDKLYKVQVGAYANKANATKMVKTVKAAGFDAFVTTETGDVVA